MCRTSHPTTQHGVLGSRQIPEWENADGLFYCARAWRAARGGRLPLQERGRNIVCTCWLSGLRLLQFHWRGRLRFWRRRRLLRLRPKTKLIARCITNRMAATYRRLSLALLAVLLPGCASTVGEPGLDRRANPNDPAQIERAKIDRATCIGEASKAEAGSVVRSKSNFDDAYDSCMAKRGYARQ